MRRYRSGDEDSARWNDFPFRDGDIVVSTRSKHGTTWVQTICLLLIHRTPEFPAALADLSPWVDWLGEPMGDVVARLRAQDHRRVVKTHTPLDGIPLDARATFVVVARHPLDAVVSLVHQGDNLDRARIAELTGAADPERLGRPPIADAVRMWLRSPADADVLDSLPNVMHHMRDAWARRDDPNVVLVHYADLEADLAREMARIADAIDLERPTADLITAASFDAMRGRADMLAPDQGGVLRDRTRFFRRGRSGEGAEVVDIDHYLARVRELAPHDLLTWLHRNPESVPVAE